MLGLIYIISVVCSVLVWNLIGRMLPKKQGWRYPVLFCSIFTVALTIASWAGDENLLILFPFFIGAFLYCFAGNFLARLVTGNVFYCLWLSMASLVDTAIFDLEISVRIKCVLWICLCFLLWRLLTKDKRIILPRRLWILVGVLSIPPLMAILSFCFWNIPWRYRVGWTDIVEGIAMTNLPFVTLSSFAILAVILILARHEELEQEHQINQMRQIYYKGQENEQKQVRALRHDLRNHFTAIRGLLLQEDLSRAVEYLDKIIEEPALHGMKRFCENETANAILTSKVMRMYEEGLQPEVTVALSEHLPIEDIDLCVLLGNALDNAIEAAVKAKDKRISIRARSEKGVFMLCVENAFSGQRQPGSLHTTKPDTRDHGFGLSNMRAIAARYGGTIEVKAENNRFELLVCFLLQDKAANA